MTLGTLLLAAERLGFKAAEVKPDKQGLLRMPPPFLLSGRRPGEGWLVRRRVGDHLVLHDPDAGASAAVQVDTVVDLAHRVVLLKPLATAGAAAASGGARSCGACARCCGSSASPRS